MASEYDALLEATPAQPKSEYDQLLEPAQPQTKGFSAFMQGLDLASIPRDVLSNLTPVTAAPRTIKQAIDVIRGVPVAQAIPESQELVGIEKKPLEQRISAGLNVATQLAFLAAGSRALPLKEIAFGNTPRTEAAPSLRETAFGKPKPETLSEAVAQEEVINNASKVTSAEGVPSAQVRPRVDEEASLRQQGQAPQARQTEEAPVAPVPQPEQPVSEAGQAPAVAGQPKIISTAVQTPQGIIRGEGFEPHDSIAARVATERPLPTTETGKPKTQFQVGDTIRWTEEDNQGRKTYPSGKVTAVNREHPDMKAFYQVEGQEYPIREDLARPISSEYRVWFRQPGDDLPSWKSIPNAKNVSLESAPNYEFFTYKGEGKQGKWYVVEKSTGMALNESPTRQAAIAKAESQIQSRGLDQFQKDLDYAREQQAQPVSEGGTRPSGVAAALPEEQKGFIIRDEQGNERFTNDRGEAAGIATEAGQVKPEFAGTTELHSQQLQEAGREIPTKAVRMPNKLEQAVALRKDSGSLATYGLREQQEWLKGAPPKTGRITLYRATPEGKPIEPGDYVSNSKSYVQQHIESNLGREGKITQIEATLDDIYPADGPNEFWYAPKSIESTSISKQPTSPTKPSTSPSIATPVYATGEAPAVTRGAKQESGAPAVSTLAEQKGAAAVSGTEMPPAAAPAPPVPPAPPETPEALGEALSEKPRLAGPSNRVLQERAARGEIPQAPESGHGILKEDLLAQANQRYSPERAQLSGQRALQGRTTLDEDADIVLHEEKLTKSAADAERAMKANPTDPALQQAYQTARNAMTDWQHGPVAAIKTAWSNKGINLQGATDVDTGTLVGLQKYAWDTAKRDFTPQEIPIMNEAANRVSRALTEEKASIVKANDAVQKVLKPSRYMDLNQLRESLAGTLKSITC